MNFINYSQIVICSFLRTKNSLHMVRLSLFLAQRYYYMQNNRKQHVMACSSAQTVMINLIASRCSTHRLFLCFILLHISNGSVSASLVGYVLYLANLMSAMCITYFHLMVHKYIYSRYSSVFLTLYQLYHFLPFSTLILFSSLYLSIAT